MDVRMTNLGEAPLLETRGDIDHSNCSLLDEALSVALDAGSTVVFIDLEHVSYIDSGGLSVLLSAVRRLRGTGWLGVIAPNANVSRLLEIVGLLVDPAVRVFTARADAETALAQAAPAR
jgi:anti-sigma B factor antagonist